MQRGTLRGRGAGTGGCLGTAFGSQRGSFPGPGLEGRSWGAGECRPMQPGVPLLPCSSAEQRERALPALLLLHTHGKAWEKSLWLRGGSARLQEPAGSRGDPASGKRGGKVLCEVQDPGAEGQRPCCPHGHAGVAAGARCRPGGARCPQRGRHGAGAAGRECPCLRRGAPPELFGHLCPCAPRGGPERGQTGRSPLSHRAGTRGSSPRSERRSRGAPRYFGQGLGVWIHSSSPHLRGGCGCA